MTDDGQGFHDRMLEKEPSAKELVTARLLREAEFNQELIDRLGDEYHSWYDENGNEALNWADRGPLGNWRQIENFMKAKYPAAYRGFDAGMETAGDVLDQNEWGQMLTNKGERWREYETGPDAISQYGYDPKEIAAGMLLLHNKTHSQRGDRLDQDIDRLSDIAQKRMQMQRDYESRTARLLRIAAALAPEVPQRLQQEYDDWAKDRDPLDFPSPGKADYGVGHWPNIETFMKDKYPAAHRGLFYGMEDAQPLLDNPGGGQRWLEGKDPYAGGAKALEEYGYDPSEIAAAMLLLHNQAHGHREHFYDADVERLTDIARKRQRMQPRAAARDQSDDWHERTTTPAQLRKEHEESINFGQPTEKWRIPDRILSENYVRQKSWGVRPPTDGQEQLSQDALPGMEDILGEDTALWRGTPIDTHDPAFRRVWQMTYGQGEPVDDPGMFPDADLRYEDRGGRFDHPDLADAILQGFEERGGVGTHHSLDPGIAEEYARGFGDGSYSDKAIALQGPQPLPVLMQTQWNGRGENYNRNNTGNSLEEQEIILRRQKAPLDVRQLMVPESAQDSREMITKVKPQSPWQSVLGDPAHITAAYVDRTAMPRQDAYGNNWGDHSRQTEEPTYPTDQVWYHRSDHDLPEGTMLTPSGGKSKWDEVYREDDNRKKWVWMYQPEMDSFYALGTGKNLYQVQPEGEGPLPVER